MDLDAIVNLAETAWNITLVASGRELHGPCPFCGEGRDRFIVWPEGNYWCRVCEASGRVPGSGEAPIGRETLHEVVAAKRVKQRAKLTEWQRGYAAGYVAGYHAAMRDAKLRSYWLEAGITEESVERHQLGYTPARTFEGQEHKTFASPAYTIPHTDPTTLALVNCQYRIMDLPPDAGGKYRQEPGLPPASFYTLPKVVSGPGAVVVEGGKKAIVISQLVNRKVQVIGWPGATPSEELYFDLEGFDVLWLAMDPGPGRTRAEERARDYLGDRVRVASFSAKPDDAVVQYGMTRETFRNILSQAR